MDDTRWEISIVCAFSDAEPSRVENERKKAPTFQVFIASQAFAVSRIPLPPRIDGSFKQYLACGNATMKKIRWISGGDVPAILSNLSSGEIRVQLFSSGRESKRRGTGKFLEMDTFCFWLWIGGEINYTDSWGHRRD